MCENKLMGLCDWFWKGLNRTTEQLINKDIYCINVYRVL